MWDGFEAGFEIRIQHVCVALLQECSDSTQCILAASPRLEAVTLFGKIPLEDWFKDLPQGGLHHAISDRGDTRRSVLFRARLRYPYSSDGLWPVPTGSQFLGKLFELNLMVGRIFCL